MPVITFANTKGGAGKTTAVLLLATELARKGYRVTILDADPQHWISRWHEISGHVANLSVIDFVTTASLPLHISENKHNTDYFIVDLPGARNPLLATAVGLSDHVLIPIQGCAMDARGGAQVLELLQYLDEKAGIKIGHSVVLTRVNSMVTTRARKSSSRCSASGMCRCSIRLSSNAPPSATSSTVAARCTRSIPHASATSTRPGKTLPVLPKK